MKRGLKYGQHMIQSDLGSTEMCTEIVPRVVPASCDIEQEVFRAFDSPGGLRNIIGKVERGTTVSIIVDDPRCITPTELMLSPVLSYLESASVDPADVTLVVARSFHTMPPADLIEAQYGRFKERGYQIRVHDSSADENLSYIGDTPSAGTPVDADSSVLHSQLRLALSSVRPRCIIGATGGSMSVLPGIVSDRTRIRNARLALQGPVAPLSIDSMIVRDMNECAEMIGLSLILNAVMDAANNVVTLVAGPLQQTWRSAVETSRHLSQVKVQRRADLTVVSAGGYPYDNTLHDAIAALPAAQSITRRGGVIVLVAECADGIGPEDFVEAIAQSRSVADLGIYGRDRLIDGLDRAWLFWQVLESNRLVVCSRIPERLVTERLHALAVKDLDEGINIAHGMVGRPVHIAVIPEGMTTVPVLLSFQSPQSGTCFCDG